MRRNTAIGLGIGAAVTAAISYYFWKKKKATVTDKVTVDVKTSEGTMTAEIRQTQGYGDVELYHPMFKQLFSTMKGSEVDDFIHSYLTIKRTLSAKNKKYEFESKMSMMTSAISYALEKKFDRGHKDRHLLGETARLIKEEVERLVEDPSVSYLKASLEIEIALVRGETEEIYIGKFA